MLALWIGWLKVCKYKSFVFAQYFGRCKSEMHSNERNFAQWSELDLLHFVDNLTPLSCNEEKFYFTLQFYVIYVILNLNLSLYFLDCIL